MYMFGIFFELSNVCFSCKVNGLSSMINFHTYFPELNTKSLLNILSSLVKKWEDKIVSMMLVKMLCDLSLIEFHFCEWSSRKQI